MNKVILALVSLFISEQSMAAATTVDNKNHQPLTQAKKARPKSSAKTGAPRETANAAHPAATMATHNTTAKKTKPTPTAEKCPKNCHEAGVMLQHIHGLRVKIEDKQLSLNPKYQKKKINPVNVAQFKGTCEKSCPQITGIQRQVDKYEKDLAALNAKAGVTPAGKATQNQAKPTQTGEKCPKNCHEAGVMLQHIHDLRVKIEDKQFSLNPKYQKKKINPVNVAQFKGTCDTSCSQITGIQRQVDKYEKDLADLNAKASPAAKPTQTGEKCPKNCHEAGVMLQHIHDLRVQIEDKQFSLNPKYQKKKINPVNVAQFKGMCDTSCPQITGIQRQVDKYEKDLADLNAKAGPAAKATQAGEKCPKNCFDLGEKLEAAYKIQLEIENEHKRQNPSYQKKSIRPVDIRRFIGKCDTSCPQIIQAEKQVQRFEKELADLKAKEQNLATTTPASVNEEASQPQRLKGQCTPNCDNEVDLRINIRQMNIELDQLKLAQDPTFKVRTYEKEINPSIKIGKQCPVGCNNIKLLETRKAQLETEIAKVKVNGNPTASQSASVKGQCTPNCDNEVDLRTDIRQLNTQVEELKHQHDPSYRMKTFKDIDQSIKIGKQCPVGCNNIKRLEKRKAELETMIATLEKTATSSPVEEETTPPEPTATDPLEEANDTGAAMPELTEETPLGEATKEASEEAPEEPMSAGAPQKKRSLFNRLTGTVTKHAVRAASTVRDAFLARPRKTDNSFGSSETYGADTEEQESDTLATGNPSMDTSAGEEPVEDQESDSSATASAEPSFDAVTNEEPAPAETADQESDPLEGSTNPSLSPSTGSAPVKHQMGEDKMSASSRASVNVAASEEPTPMDTMDQNSDTLSSNNAPEDESVNNEDSGSEGAVPAQQPSDERGASEVPSQTDIIAPEADALDLNTPSPSTAKEEPAPEQNTDSKAVLPSQPSVEEPASEEPTLDNGASTVRSPSNAANTIPDNSRDESSESIDGQYEDNRESSISTDETTEYSNTPYGDGGNGGGEIFHSDSDDNDNGNALGATAMATMGNIFNGLLAQQQPPMQQQPATQQSSAQTATIPQMAATNPQYTDNSLNDYGATIDDSNSSLDQTDGQAGLNSGYGDEGTYGDFADTTDANGDSPSDGNDPSVSNAYASY
ncbi:hypothetical protein [Candidatus Odyssella acanthamoebae]|uniref:Uncharacterized protein n=1 Tax=Candidatus Odyssella acanthamoebae TaxID=91604 RepID=A0A077AYZ7_9PROT|nr:hypothetical protein [Candidatus Paracaedibacter acanthamoebae]AIK97239.1 hypothetical protein ID47_11615 [Candidatus Paracaedibacter acanthamoebae]